MSGLFGSGGKADQQAAIGMSESQLRDLKKLEKERPDIARSIEELKLEAPELVGLLEAQQLGPSEMEDISLDPRLRDAQMSALEELQERGQVGLTAQDRAQLNEMRRDEAARSEAQQAGILQQMAERGAMDSGAQLAAQLASQQGSAQRRAEGADRMAAQAANQRASALAQSANLAGGIGQQQFAQQAQKASAADAIARFNAANRQQVQGQNLGARQNIANQQASLANQKALMAQGAGQQDFQNRLSILGAQGGARGNLASQYAQQGQAKEAAKGQMIGAAAGIAGSALGGPIGGAIAKSLFRDGGIARAEDGDVMYASDGSGDIVGGDSYEGDRVDARINSGEMVLNAAQQQRLMDLIRGELSPEEIDNGEEIVEGVPESYRNELHEMPKKDDKKKKMSQGLKRLLEMLGE